MLSPASASCCQSRTCMNNPVVGTCSESRPSFCRSCNVPRRSSASGHPCRAWTSPVRADCSVPVTGADKNCLPGHRRLDSAKGATNIDRTPRFPRLRLESGSGQPRRTLMGNHCWPASIVRRRAVCEIRAVLRWSVRFCESFMGSERPSALRSMACIGLVLGARSYKRFWRE